MTNSIPALIKRAEHATAKADQLLAEAGFPSIGAMRWHFTANPDHDERVSYAEYARQTGADRNNVRKSAQAHASANGLDVAPPRDKRGGARQTTDDPKSEVATSSVKVTDDTSKADEGEHGPTPTQLAKAALAAVRALAQSVTEHGKPEIKGYAQAVGEAWLLLNDLLEMEADAALATAA